MLGKTRNFISEVKVELQKASWPWEPKEKGMKKYKELVDSTLIVLIAMLLLAGYVALWDSMMLVIVGFLSKEEGGRHTPFFTNYRPQFYFRTTDVTGSVKLAEGVEMVMPGDNVSIEVELITPVAMEKTMRFAVREGGKTVGAGRITEILDLVPAK